MAPKKKEKQLGRIVNWVSLPELRETGHRLLCAVRGLKVHKAQKKKHFQSIEILTVVTSAAARL